MHLIYRSKSGLHGFEKQGIIAMKSDKASLIMLLFLLFSLWFLQ